MAYEFMGYVRPDGQVGCRNHVAVMPSVTCAGDVASAIVRQVAGTVGYFHHQGCCQLPPDLDRVTETLISLGKSPNVAAVLVVSLGCEGTDHERLTAEIRKTGKPVRIIRIQELGGVSAAIKAGIDAAQELVMLVSGIQRQPVSIDHITMAIKCGASDTTSGMASNCVVGYVADKLVDLGATVVFGETTEFLGGEHLLARRAVDPEVSNKIYEIVNRMEARARSLGCDMRKGQPTPGNIEGGLSSIEEKSLGAIVKSGTRPIQGVMEYPETIGQRKGLGIGGRRESLFILATDTVQNVIWVGEGDAHPGLWRPALHIAPGEIHWVNPARELTAGQSARFSVRIRYRQPLQGARLFVRDEGAYLVFDRPQRGITPGQFAAWYDGDQLVGSGVIG